VERALPGAENDEVSSLRHYTLTKQEVAASVRAAKQLFQTCGAQEAAERCRALVVQLAEDRFNLAVVGQFKRGKSSLMNAVLGRDLLPTGLLPLTSAITTLCYGSTERVVLRRKGWALEQEVPLAQLADFITERGNPGNEKGLEEARVELPLPFLRRGLHFIDTPGIGSARHQNTATTYAFLPQMAAVIFVTSVDAPFSEAEERFLVDIRGQVRQLFIVVNKMDMLGNTYRPGNCHKPISGPQGGRWASKRSHADLSDLYGTGTGTFCVLLAVAIHARHEHLGTAHIRGRTRLVPRAYMAVSRDGFAAGDQ
jgi:GTP-binding protein EngB required for normal cell division